MSTHLSKDGLAYTVKLLSQSLASQSIKHTHKQTNINTQKKDNRNLRHQLKQTNVNQTFYFHLNDAKRKSAELFRVCEQRKSYTQSLLL